MKRLADIKKQIKVGTKIRDEHNDIYEMVKVEPNDVVFYATDPDNILYGMDIPIEISVVERKLIYEIWKIVGWAYEDEPLRCKKCGMIFEYAKPNQEDGTLICYKCRSGF